MLHLGQSTTVQYIVDSAGHKIKMKGNTARILKSLKKLYFSHKMYRF